MAHRIIKMASRTFLDALSKAGDRQERVSVGDIQEAVGQRSFGPFLLVPAIIEVSPIGGIPGLLTALAVIVVLFSAQLLFGKKHLWSPKRSRSVRSKAKS